MVVVAVLVVLLLVVLLLGDHTMGGGGPLTRNTKPYINIKSHMGRYGEMTCTGTGFG